MIKVIDKENIDIVAAAAKGFWAYRIKKDLPLLIRIYGTCIDQKIFPTLIKYTPKILNKSS